MPRPQNEKGGIRGKTRECRLIYLLNNHSTTQGKKILRKMRDDSQNGKAGIGKGPTFSRAVCGSQGVAL